MWMHGNFIVKTIRPSRRRRPARNPPLLNSGTVIVSPLVPVPSTPQEPAVGCAAHGNAAYVRTRRTGLAAGQHRQPAAAAAFGADRLLHALPPRPMPARSRGADAPPSDDGPMIIPGAVIRFRFGQNPISSLAFAASGERQGIAKE